MSIGLLFLQLLLVILAITAVLVAGPIYRWFRYRVLAKDTEESPYHRMPWFWTRPVETGILEVGFATTAAALALPAFVPPDASTPEILFWIFQGATLISSSLAAVSSLWLYRIYVQQQAMPSKAPNESINVNPQRWWFWIRDSGPYSLLAVAMMLLLIGLGSFALIVAMSKI